MDACKEISYEVIHNQYKNHVHAALNTSMNFSIQQSRHDCMRVIIQEMNSSLVMPSLQTINQSRRKPFDASYLRIMDLGPT